MKEIFSLTLLIVATAFFSRKFIFQKRVGLVSLSGIEVYITGILFSFIIGKTFLNSLAPIAFVTLAFIGFSFGAQFRREIIKETRLNEVLFGFLLSLQYVAMFFILKRFYAHSTAAVLAAVFSIPAPLILHLVRNRLMTISGELSVVFMLIYYSILQFNTLSPVYAIITGLLGFIFVLFERILEKSELYVLLIGFLLFISGISQVFHFSTVFSAAIFGFITAFYSNAKYTDEIKQNLDQPLFLTLLFFAGIFFSPLFFILFPSLLVILIKPFILFPLFRNKGAIFIPFGALSIAVAMESMSFNIITFAVISYFFLLALSELIREKARWAI